MPQFLYIYLICLHQRLYWKIRWPFLLVKIIRLHPWYLIICGRESSHSRNTKCFQNYQGISLICCAVCNFWIKDIMSRQITRDNVKLNLFKIHRMYDQVFQQKSFNYCFVGWQCNNDKSYRRGSVLSSAWCHMVACGSLMSIMLICFTSIHVTKYQSGLN